MRQIVLTLIGLLLIAMSIFVVKKISNSKKDKRPIPTKVVKTVFANQIKNTTVPIVIPANGTLVAKRRIEVFAEVQGVFKPGTKAFKPGQRYRTGQALITVDNSEYYATVQSAKSNFYNAITAIMPDLRLDFPDVFSKWQQYLNTFKIEQTTSKLPEMNSEKERYFITGRGIVSNYYDIKNLEQRLSKYSIKAPFNGILTQALVTEGSLIRNGQKLGEYIDPSVYEMEVGISKSYIDLLQVGKKVSLSNLEHTQTYQGTVSRINGSVDPTTQTVTVYIEVKDNTLKEGIYLEAQLAAKQEENAIEIDRNLLLEDNKIFVVRDTILDLIAVKPVYFGSSKVVLKNVPEGTVILSKPLQGAFPGMRVKVANKNTL